MIKKRFFLVFLFLLSFNGFSDEAYTESIEIKGNNIFSERKIKRLMATKGSFLFIKRVFRKEILEEDIKNIRRAYKNEGYYKTAIESSIIKLKSKENYVRVIVKIDENSPVILSGIKIEGRDEMPLDLIGSIIHFTKGDTFRIPEIDKKAAEIINLYNNNGFPDSELNTETLIDTAADTGRAVFKIKENGFYRVGELITKHKGLTKDAVIKRQISINKNDTVDYREILRTERRLYQTGLFRKVDIRIHDYKKGEKLLKVNIQEKKPMYIEAKAGYGSYEYARLSSEFRHINLFGMARTFGFRGKISVRRRLAEISLGEPWLFGIPLKTNLRGFISYDEEPGYKINKKGAVFTSNYPAGSNADLAVSYRHENSAIFADSAMGRSQKLRIRSLSPVYSYDTRDDLFNTGDGTFLRFGGEFAGESFTEIRFMKIQSQLRFFETMSQGFIFASALNTGIIIRGNTNYEVPRDEKFYAGGDGSIRGLPYRMAGPLLSDGSPAGGIFKIVLNIAELRKKLYKKIGGVLFFDAGNVWQSTRSADIQDIYLTAGPGLRINTPIGTLRGDIGFILYGEKSEGGWAAHGSVGQMF